MRGRRLWDFAFPRATAPGVPIIGREPVASGDLDPPDDLRPVGRNQAMVEVEMFPGSPDLEAWEFQIHERPNARSRMPHTPRMDFVEGEWQTVSNLSRAQLAALESGAELAGPGTLEIFEGTAV